MNKPLAGRQAVCWGLWRNSEPGLAGLNRPGPLRWDRALAAWGAGQLGGGNCGGKGARVCVGAGVVAGAFPDLGFTNPDRKSTRLNSSH